jgi:hypothetical protein
MRQHQDLPLLGGIAGFLRWLESLAVIASGPLLTVGLGIALVDLLTDGALLTNAPALLFAWAISQAIGVDAQLVGSSFQLAHSLRSRRYPAAIGYSMLVLALGYVGFIAAQVFATQEAEGITTAQALGALETTKGEVLYLALEDNERRIQRRVKQMLDGETVPEGFHIVYQWLPLDRGGIDAFHRWMDERPNTRLIVIDTLEHVRAKRNTTSGVYADDYAAARALQRFASDRQVAVVPIHHLRKASAEDPMDEISGSTGLTGGVDNVLVMRSVNGITELARKGRDFIDDSAMALKGDPKTLLWTWQGKAEDVQRSGARKDILDALDKAPQGLSPKEIALALGKKPEAVRFLVFKMHQAGEITQIGIRYFTHAHAANTANATNDVKQNGHKPANTAGSRTDEGVSDRTRPPLTLLTLADAPPDGQPQTVSGVSDGIEPPLTAMKPHEIRGETLPVSAVSGMSDSADLDGEE